MAGMPILTLTTEQLEREFVRVFSDGVAVPDKLWVETFHDDASYIRAVYAREFPSVAADRLMRLRDALVDQYGHDAHVAIVVFFEDEDWPFFAAHRLNIHLAR